LSSELNFPKKGGARIFSAVGVLRWDSAITLTLVNEIYKAKCGDLVEMVKKTCKDPRTLELAGMIERDLKSESGLKIGFPFSILMSLVRLEVSEKEIQLLLDQMQK